MNLEYEKFGAEAKNKFLFWQGLGFWALFMEILTQLCQDITKRVFQSINKHTTRHWFKTNFTMKWRRALSCSLTAEGSYHLLEKRLDWVWSGLVSLIRFNGLKITFNLFAEPLEWSSIFMLLFFFFCSRLVFYLHHGLFSLLWYSSLSFLPSSEFGWPVPVACFHLLGSRISGSASPQGKRLCLWRSLCSLPFLQV